MFLIPQIHRHVILLFWHAGQRNCPDNEHRRANSCGCQCGDMHFWKASKQNLSTFPQWAPAYQMKSIYGLLICSSFPCFTLLPSTPYQFTQLPFQIYLNYQFRCLMPYSTLLIDTLAMWKSLKVKTGLKSRQFWWLSWTAQSFWSHMAINRTNIMV